MSERYTFPAPPFEVGKYFEPITNSDQLRSECKWLEHEFPELVEDVTRGNRYFFIWKGEVTAIIELERQENLDWLLKSVGPRGHYVIEHSVLFQIQNYFEVLIELDTFLGEEATYDAEEIKRLMMHPDGFLFEFDEEMLEEGQKVASSMSWKKRH